MDVAKQGYDSYSSGFRERYVLERQSNTEEVSRIVKSDGDDQLRGLRELLAGSAEQFQDTLFFYEARLRPALRALSGEPKVTTRVRRLLSLIGVSEDLHLIMQLAPPPKAPIFPGRWRYNVAIALVNPDGEDEWSFLRRCAINEFRDGWVDAGAIQALKLTGTSRSREILEEAQQKNQSRARLIGGALDYIKTNPPALTDPDLEILAKRVAVALAIGTSEGNGAPRYNEAGDKALVDLTFHSGDDFLWYTATFHKIDGVWALRGAHESLQAYAPRARMTVTPQRK